MKHRQNIYVVVRTAIPPNSFPITVLDSFFSLEGAENRAGAYAQTMKERGIEGLSFNVFPSTYYDQ